jgi:hypothetical protein
VLAGKTSIDQEELPLVPSRLMQTRSLSFLVNPHRLGNLIASKSEINCLTTAENSGEIEACKRRKSKFGKIQEITKIPK